MTEVMPQFIQVKLDRAKKETTEEVTEEVTKETTEKVTRDYLLNILNILNTTNLTLDGAMDLLGIPEADRPMYKDLLKKK
ncbi:hypothetical protein RCG42_01245 [Lactobacillus delbrueckii subsp. lactis]|uniref:hypothetical protein n=1 Tax=Lactobacillus delbrueckii TaxID=1584 RepID=UPI0027F5C19F|nr:hypothetical protein [Lactobacillus delbrueckii]MDQ7160841.1 hypothetical protein [Lactobacillus delbrueckii subsp. lactis]MDQ7163382.1 hypothetical protein [Lactobacillus delbrueckii subsp. lactis]MDQ7177693.1 hypothetical protein [Lactobacillus delbrueckii subsp. lactis]MDQ7205664.1 hypothetical protein [Lactobacillus delbrueckii subsp. lactis]